MKCQKCSMCDQVTVFCERKEKKTHFHDNQETTKIKIHQRIDEHRQVFLILYEHTSNDQTAGK